ncbi:MAG: histidinol-phosphatase [Gemmatimonadota bacterium]
MDPTRLLREDHHVHSTVSDGSGSLEDNVCAAAQRGVGLLGFVEHVRRDTRWVQSYVHEVRRLRNRHPLTLTCGIEAKILDLDGTLDLPRDVEGVDRIVIADHQLPGPGGPIHPADARAAVTAGIVSPGVLVRMLVAGTVEALQRHPGSLIAHLFSLLPKLGVSEEDVPEDLVSELAEAALRSGATLELSERWMCPSPAVARVFYEIGVPIVASTDAHEPGAIGRYDFVRRTISHLCAVSPRG